jgi:Domain of unknown function (DUF4258)
MDRPDWWSWDLAFTEHVEGRMAERGLSDVGLRTMLEDATSLIQRGRRGRWTVQTRYEDRPWVVVVEPDWDERLLYVVTVYPKDRP